MFAKFSPDHFITPIDGIEMKTFVYGENSLLSRFHLKKGAQLPRHSHPQEQTGVLISGKLNLYIDGEKFLAEAGDSWCIKGDVEHWAEVEEDAVAIEVFSPVRADYLPEQS